MELQIERGALSILAGVHQFLSQRRIEAYLVGGFVRDTLIGRTTGDIDLAITADVLQIAPELAAALGGKFVLLDEANRIARVVLPKQPGSSVKAQWYVDFSSLDGDIHQDLARRDFTIDAMAIDLKLLIENPSQVRIIDPFEGQKDLKQGIIQANNEVVFETDPARLLRAVRLAAELDFAISPGTQTLIQKYCSLITRVAGERVREELLRILAAQKAGQSVRILDDLGLLTAIIPELEPSRGVEQPKEHHWDVLNHSLETVRAVDYLLRRSAPGGWEYGSSEILNAVPWSDVLSQYFESEIGTDSTKIVMLERSDLSPMSGVNREASGGGKSVRRASLLKLAALLHDIAKPETRIVAKERVRFFGHTEQGAATVAGILEKLRFSKRETRLVELMVRYHLRPTQMSHEGMPTQRAIYRFFRDAGSAGIDILFLSLADHLAARGPDLDLEQWKWHTDQVSYVLTEYFRQESVTTPLKLIDGHDLINLFGLKPGPAMREILETVREAQAAGELADRDEALSYVKNRLLYREQN